MVTLHEGKQFIIDNSRIATAEEAAKLSEEEGRKETLTYQILAAHNHSGDMKNLEIQFDSMGVYDNTYVGILQTAYASGLKEFPMPCVFTNCHNCLCAVGGTINTDVHKYAESACKKSGGIFVPPHEAVIHQYMREMIVKSGDMSIVSDSHTRYGTQGSVSIGEGGPELAKAMLGKYYEIDYPEVIGSAESVKGATILGTIGNISHYMAIDYVQKMGLTMGDVNFLNMETSNVYTAFVSGSGDLACMGSPSAALKLLDEGYVLVGGLKQQGVPQQDSILVSEDFYQNHRQAAVAFMAAWMEASALLNADQTYEKTCMSTFYREQGRTDFTEEDIAREAEWNTYTDPENYAEKPLGAWMQSLISC